MSENEVLYENYIGASWRKATGTHEIVINDPATGRPYRVIGSASTDDVDAAVKAARAAFKTRALYEMQPHARMQLLFRIAGELRAMREAIVPVLIHENGKSVSFARDEVECAAQYFEYYGGIADKIHGKSIPLGGGLLDYAQLVPLASARRSCRGTFRSRLRRAPSPRRLLAATP